MSARLEDARKLLEGNGWEPAFIDETLQHMALADEDYTPSPVEPAAPMQAPELAERPSILDDFARELKRLGYVGDPTAAQLVYLAGTSRLFARPVSVALKGPSSGGKSYTVEIVLRFFPLEAYYEISGMSEKSLAYDDEPISHRMFVIYEAAGMSGDMASYFMRTLLSEGRIVWKTLDSTKDGIKNRTVEREGPVSLLVTTTDVNLHPENETRILSVPITDSPEQTKAIMLALAEEENEEVDLSEWVALQEWIYWQSSQVAVPYYAKTLMGLIPPVAVRLRRDASTILGLIRAHALLHQASRERDSAGRILPALDDYAVVRGLVSDLISDKLGQTVRPETRETVEAVAALLPEHPGGVALPALAAKLALDRASVSRRARVARSKGYLDNKEDRRGKPARYVLDEPLPDDLEILPPVEVLHSCTVAGDKGGGA